MSNHQVLSVPTTCSPPPPPCVAAYQDDRLLTVLGMLRESGKKVFLATNSLWDYTHVVMNFLLAGATGRAMSLSWLSHFDVVITGCGKPAFFSSKQPLFEVDTATGAPQLHRRPSCLRKATWHPATDMPCAHIHTIYHTCTMSTCSSC